MKGGKEGRKRRSASGGAKRKTGTRGGAKEAAAKRQWNDAPKRGSKGKPKFGGSSSSGEE